MAVGAKKAMGRPKVASYRNKTHRMSKIEDKLLNAISSMKSRHDKELLLGVLEELKK